MLERTPSKFTLLTFVGILLATLGMIEVVSARSLESDCLWGTSVVESLPPRDAEGIRPSAEAQARMILGFLREEEVGQDLALEQFRKALQLEPGELDLALRVAQEELRRGDTVSAAAVLKDASKAKPGIPEPLVALARLYLRHMGKPDLAIKFARRALAIEPCSFDAYEVLWEAHRMKGANIRARAVLQEAEGCGSKDANFYLSLAELRLNEVSPPGKIQKESLKAAARLAEKAVELASGKPKLLIRAGDTLLQAGEIALALDAYERAYRAKSSLPGLREKLAAIAAEAGKIEQAVEVLNEILRLNPLNLSAYDQLVQIYYRQGEFRKAADHARQALILDATRPERHLVLAELLFQDEQYLEAAKVLAEARQKFPAFAKLAHMQALALSQGGKPREALKIFDEARSLANFTQPEMLDAVFFFDYGVAAERAGEQGLAEAMFLESIRLDPENAAKAHNYLGYMLVEMGTRLDEAEQHIRRALELNPNSGEFTDSLGWLEYKRGRFDVALELLLKALELLEEPDPVVLDHTGDALAALGRIPEALGYWRKAHKLNPLDDRLARKIEDANQRLVQMETTAGKK